MVLPKFIIHLDINGTIMPADPIKSKHVKSMLNLHLSKQAFVRRQEGPDEMVWWDGSPFHKGDKPPLLPQFRYTCHILEHYNEVSAHHMSFPLTHSVSLEDFNAMHEGTKCDDFTASHLPGSVYESELLNLLDALEWKHPEASEEVIETLTLPVAEGRRMNLFVPAFLELLQYLHAQREEREYVLVIRTFGSDIPRVLPAFDLITQGLHPDLPIANCISSPQAFGRLVRSGDHFTLDMQSVADSGAFSVDGALKIMEYFEGLDSGSVVMVNDDYDVWRDSNFSPLFGKPVFVDLATAHVARHFLFDDNVNMNPNDSIAACWLRADGGFLPLPLSTGAGRATIGTVLLQASLYNSILHPDAFVTELTKADLRYESLATRIAHTP